MITLNLLEKILSLIYLFEQRKITQKKTKKKLINKIESF